VNAYLSFTVPEEDLAGEELEVARWGAQTAAAKGEPWLTRFRPQELCTRQTGLGFGTVFHLTPQDANLRYFAGRQDGLQAPEQAQLVSGTT
jgi:hypothetical protein